jgi:hypothetical protein
LIRELVVLFDPIVPDDDDDDDDGGDDEGVR